MSSSSNSPCAACKLLRRKCTQGCVFAPYFPPDQPSKFANVHKVFGASNVSKLLNELPVAQREDAVNSLAYEAEARLRDPVYGCVAYISILQQRIKTVREEIANARKELSGYIGQAAFAPVVPAAAAMHHPAALAHYAGMGLHPHHQQQLAIQQHAAPHQYNHLHQQQLVDAQQMAAAVEVAARGQHQHHQHQQDMMMMRQGYAPPHGAAGGPTVAIVPPGPGSANPAAYGGAQAQFLIQQQQQPTPSALTTFRTDQQSPPPQSSGHSHVDMSHAPQHQHHRHHTDGSDEGSGGAPPSA